MDMETRPQQADSAPSTSSPFPRAWWGRALYGAYVILFPSLCFASIELLKPEWQTGRFGDYVILLLFPEASWIFFILLAYSVTCYLLVLYMPDRFARSFLVRAGIYTGVLLALQYTVLVMFANNASVFWLLLIWIFPLGYSILYQRAVRRWAAAQVNRFLLIVFLTVLLLSALITRGSALFLLLAGLTLAAPFWSLLLALQATSWLLKNHETKFTLPRGIGLAAWLGAYVIAWRFDILKMYQLYAALPPSPPPDCYIATAAARGHPRFVGARMVTRLNGDSMPINRQLQRLKCLELAILAVAPHTHRTLRQVYDRAGKWLAGYIRHPYVADLAYLSMKPGEWLAIVLLKLLVPEIDALASTMYISVASTPSTGRET